MQLANPSHQRPISVLCCGILQPRPQLQLIICVCLMLKTACASAPPGTGGPDVQPL